MNKKNSNFIFWLVAIIAILLLTLGMVKLASAPRDNSEEQTIDAVTEADNIRGNSEAAITLIEYSDFQCPACGQYFNILEQLVAEMGDQVRLVYRHFPLKTLHPNAEPAAIATEAASQQGKFWEMHDLLFTNQTKWSSEKNPTNIFISYAESLGLDVAKFTVDLDSDVVKNKVRDDIRSATQAGLNSTPTFYINGHKIKNPNSYNAFVNEINNALNQ